MCADTVQLHCKRVRGKLRIVVEDDRYFKNLFCQFPRSIRLENRLYVVKLENIRIICGRRKDFYKILKPQDIRIVDEVEYQKQHSGVHFISRIFQSEDELCAICMDQERFIIYQPCGHYYVCKECSIQLKKCPICRCDIQKKLLKTQLNLE